RAGSKDPLPLLADLAVISAIDERVVAAQNREVALGLVPRSERLQHAVGVVDRDERAQPGGKRDGQALAPRLRLRSDDLAHAVRAAHHVVTVFEVVLNNMRSLDRLSGAAGSASRS